MDVHLIVQLVDYMLLGNALGLGPGDILWAPAISFVASANCGLYCGASVDFLDISKITLNVCPIFLKQKLIDAKELNSLPKVVVVVHLAGAPAPLKEIFDLSKEYGFKIIEDASHAIGASYRNNLVGNCKYSNITIFSFHPVKIITSGEGGLATTNDETLLKKMTLFRSHGVTRIHEDLKNGREGAWYYEQQTLGYNYRMNELEAALGINQLKRLDSIVKKRREIVIEYQELLSELPVDLPNFDDLLSSSWHLYIIRLKNIEKITRRHVFDEMRKFGIGGKCTLYPNLQTSFL